MLRLEAASVTHLATWCCRLVKFVFIYFFFGKTFKLLAFYVLVKPRRALTQLVDRFRKALHTLWKFKGK